MPGAARSVLNDISGELAYGVRKPELMEAYKRAEEWKKGTDKMEFKNLGMPRRSRR